MAISSFEIVSVPVADQEMAKKFYRDILGFDLLRVNSSTIDHDHQDLTAKGLELSKIDQQPWGRFAMFKDPDGNGWILRQPPT